MTMPLSAAATEASDYDKGGRPHHGAPGGDAASTPVDTPTQHVDLARDLVTSKTARCGEMGGCQRPIATLPPWKTYMDQPPGGPGVARFRDRRGYQCPPGQ